MQKQGTHNAFKFVGEGKALVNPPVGVPQNVPELINPALGQEFSDGIELHLLPDENAMPQHHPQAHLANTEKKLILDALGIGPAAHPDVLGLIHQHILQVEVLVR